MPSGWIDALDATAAVMGGPVATPAIMGGPVDTSAVSRDVKTSPAPESAVPLDRWEGDAVAPAPVTSADPWLAET
jgi:hypothetical protein